MPQNTPRDEKWLLRHLGEVDRRVRALETAPRAGHTSVSSGGVVVQDGGGVFIYDGTPAAGNLIVSIAGEGGADTYGNAYPQGMNVTAGEIDGTLINAATISAGAISAGSIGSSSIVNSDFSGGTVEDTTITFDSGGGALLVYASTTTTQTFTSSGTWTAPAGVTSVTVECWGGGAGGAGGGNAGGANSGGYGGGGGAYAKATVTVTPGNTYPYAVGDGGPGGAVNNLGSNGGSTSFNSSAVVAKGGQAATLSHIGYGGSASASTGSVKFGGGDGGTATYNAGGGGGASAGSSSNGNDGANSTSSTGGAGGAGVTGSSGSGGAGGNVTGGGGTGHFWGGGGGGGGGAAGPDPAAAGGTGAGGQVRLTYTSGSALIASVAGMAGTDQYGHSYPAGVAIAAGKSVAFDPVNGGAETWHTLPLTNGWSNFGTGHVNGKYRLLPNNLVEVIGRSSHAAVSGSSQLATALPSAYRPASTQDFDCAVFGNSTAPTATPVLTLDTSGVLTLFDLPSGTTSVAYHIFYSLDA